MSDSCPSIAVVIPAYGPAPHLPAILEALLRQTVRPDRIVVSHSGIDDPREGISATFPGVTVIHSDSRLYAGAARNRGAALVGCEILAFCDSDVLPATNWLERLMAPLQSEERRFVVGSVGMARRGGYWGQANWLCEFSEQAPWRRSGLQTGGASCNMAVRRSDFEAVGGFPEQLTPGEDTLLFFALRGAGLEQWFERSAMVGHFNHSGFSAFASHQFRLGRTFAHVRKVRELPGSFAVRHRPLAAGLWLAKDALVLRRTLADGLRGALRAAALLPGILVGGWIWTAGCLWGSARES